MPTPSLYEAGSRAAASDPSLTWSRSGSCRHGGKQGRLRRMPAGASPSTTAPLASTAHAQTLPKPSYGATCQAPGHDENPCFVILLRWERQSQTQKPCCNAWQAWHTALPARLISLLRAHPASTSQRLEVGGSWPRAGGLSFVQKISTESFAHSEPVLRRRHPGQSAAAWRCAYMEASAPS